MLEHWSGLSFPPPRDLPVPEIEPWSPEFQADYHLSFVSSVMPLCNPPFSLTSPPLPIMYVFSECVFSGFIDMKSYSIGLLVGLIIVCSPAQSFVACVNNSSLLFFS